MLNSQNLGKKKYLNCWRNFFLSTFELSLTKTPLFMQLYSVSMKLSKRSSCYFLCLSFSITTSSLACDNFNYLASKSRLTKGQGQHYFAGSTMFPIPHYLTVYALWIDFISKPRNQKRKLLHITNIIDNERLMWFGCWRITVGLMKFRIINLSYFYKALLIENGKDTP